MKLTRSSLALAVLAAPLLGAQVHADEESTQPPDNAKAGTFSVLTYNIWHDQRDWPLRRDFMVSEIKAMNPDVIVLQEVIQREHLENQARTLAEMLGYEYFFSTVDPPERAQRYGNAILTRHTVLETDMRKLEPLDDYRTAAYMRIEVDGKPVDIYNTHLHHTRQGGGVRAMQIRDMLDFVEATREGTNRVILAGDFNANPDWDELELVLEDYVDTFAMFVDDPLAERHATLNYHEPIGHSMRRIDYVFVHRKGMEELKPVRSEIVLNEPGPGGIWASDHFGVITWFEKRF